VTTSRIAEARGRAATYRLKTQRRDNLQFYLMREKVRVLSTTNLAELKRYYQTAIEDGNYRNINAVRYGLSLVMSAMGDYRQAMEELKKLILLDEERLSYQLAMADIEIARGHVTKALNIYQTNQKIFPNKNSFLITSSDPGEGKTTVAFNFALSLEKNSQVLIIEADIRKPSVLNHYYSFHDSAEEQLGLSDIMDNKAILSDTIQKVPGTNLDLITSGKKRYDLSDLVTVDQLRALVKTLQKKYDYIIIDSAPINPVTDTLILSQVIDCIFFVVRSEKTKVLAFLSAIKKLKDIQIDVSGIIINDIDVTKYSYYDYYSQNYYYGPKMDPQQT
jgi:capsular exopolysaccharide synthesis family protein